MPILSTDDLTLIAAFAPVFSRRVWRHVQVLLVGAILAPGRRTVTALLRVMGLSEERDFQTYHRVPPRPSVSNWTLFLDRQAPAWLHLRLSIGQSVVACGRREQPRIPFAAIPGQHAPDGQVRVGHEEF